MSSPKGYGPKTYFSRFGGERPIPEKFLAAMGRKEEVQSIPDDVGPEALSDTIVESEVKTDRTHERQRRTIKKNPGPVGPLNAIHIDEKGQEVKVLQYLVATGSAQSGTPNEFTTVAREDLGNGWSIDEIAYSGTFADEGGPAPGVFTPSLFTAPTYSRDNPSAIPNKFLATTDVTTTQVDAAGVAAMPGVLPAGTYKETQQQVTQYKKRTESTTQVQPTIPSVLDKGRETNQAQQIVTVVETLLDDSTLPEVPTATKDVEVEQLGDGHKVQKTKSVSEFFDPAQFVAEIPDNIPRKFAAALPVSTIEHTVTGMAVKPSLAPGDLQASQTQVTSFMRKIRTATRSLLTLPISLVSKKTNQRKQIVTSTETYRTAGVDAVPSATQDVEVEQLGDGNVVETVNVIPSVFAETTVSKEIEDVVPPEFRTDAPNLTSELTTAGTVGSPSLGATELAHAETQIDAFTKRTRSTARTSTLPITLTDVMLDGLRAGGKTFDGAVSLVRKLSTAGQSIFTGFKTLSSKSKSLGPSHSLLETASITSFPTLTDNITDPDTGMIRNRFHDIVAGGSAHPGNTSTNFISQEQVNKDHTLRITEVADSASFTGYIRKFEGFTNIDFPAQLVTVFATNSKGGGNGGFSEGGFFSLAGNGSGSLSLAGQAQASDMLAPDVYFDIRQPWGNNIQCTHLLFLVPSGETRTNVIGKCTTAMGTTVNDWPKFAPTAANFVCVAENTSATVRVTASKTAAVRVDYTGAVIGGGSIAESSGGGTSIESTKTVRIVRLPPTIHPSLTNGSGFSGVFGALVGDGHSAPAQITTVGSGTTLTAVAQAFGSITPISLGATTGTTTIPTTGLYLARLYSEPGPLGYIKMHAEIVNMTNVV